MLNDKRYHTTSTDQKLNDRPCDMPDRGGPRPNAQVTASMVPLSRKENPVAAWGDSRGPSGSQVDSGDSSTMAKLSKTANSLYEDRGMSATTPQDSFLHKGIGKRR